MPAFKLINKHHNTTIITNMEVYPGWNYSKSNQNQTVQCIWSFHKQRTTLQWTHLHKLLWRTRQKVLWQGLHLRCDHGYLLHHDHVHPGPVIAYTITNVVLTFFIIIIIIIVCYLLWLAISCCYVGYLVICCHLLLLLLLL